MKNITLYIQKNYFFTSWEFIKLWTPIILIPSTEFIFPGSENAEYIEEQLSSITQQVNDLIDEELSVLNEIQT